MDNDIKIKKQKELSQTHKDVMLFLDDELNLLQKENAISSYNLEEEYEKTKKNKSLFSFLILAGCLVVVIFVSWGLKRYINQKNENITVNLEEFDNLNLKGLLDSVFKVQANYDNAIKEKSRIISQKELELQDAQTKLDNELFLIDSLKLSNKKEIERRKSQAQADYKKNIAEINLKYDEQIAAIEAEANEYKLQLAEYDTAKIESAKEQEKLLNSERQVQELERKKLIKEYEDRLSAINADFTEYKENSNKRMKNSVTEVAKKYQAEIDTLDPIIKNTEADELISTYKTDVEAQNFSSQNYLTQEILSDELASTAIEQGQEIYNKYELLNNVIASIPQKHSIPSYVAASKYYVNELSKGFADSTVQMYNEKVEIIQDFTNQVVELEKQVEKEKQNVANQKNINKEQEKTYKGIIENFLLLNRWNAIVISAKSKDSIDVYVRSDAVESLFVDNKVEAEITKVVKGTITNNLDGSFTFVPHKTDKNGEPVDFDFSLVTNGAQVKLFKSN
ncbi:MAG: hypothetical protein IJ293_02530 [Treponema sp.]|nr:hypothetical protein [Treponema sp.]